MRGVNRCYKNLRYLYYKNKLLLLPFALLLGDRVCHSPFEKRNFLAVAFEPRTNAGPLLPSASTNMTFET